MLDKVKKVGRFKKADQKCLGGRDCEKNGRKTKGVGGKGERQNEVKTRESDGIVSVTASSFQ